VAHHIIPKDPATPDNKTAYDLMTILPHSAEVRDGRLWIGGLDTVALAEKTGTAVYVMDEDHLRAQLRGYHDAFARCYEASEVIYAGKAFCCTAMLRLVAEERCCLDVSSGGELAFAIAAGFPLEKVYVHGNNKTEDELRECLKANVGHVVVDSFEELDRLSRLATEANTTQPILIRVTPGIEADTHDFIKTGAEDSKFGFGLNQGLALEAVKRALALPGLDFEGVHMHIGSQIFALHSFAAAIEVMVDFIDQIKRETGATVRILDTGGGLGVAYGVADEPSTIEEYAEVITGGIRVGCELRGLSVPTVAVEPGRSIVANAGVTLYTVGTIKEIPGVRTYVSVDGGMTDNIRTSLYGAHYEPLIANRADEPRSVTVTVAGKHCESGDIVVSDGPLQPARVGDILCVCATGAYCQSMSSNYNKQVRPGVVWVSGGQWRWVVRRETYDDLLRCDVG